MPSEENAGARSRRIQKEAESSTNVENHDQARQASAPRASSTTGSISAPNFALIQELFELFIALIWPNLFRPLLAIEVMSPGIAKMWPFNISSSFTAASIPSLAGKVILVTGGNNGIGKETVLQLAKHSPAKIYLAARSESKALAAINDIKSAAGTDVDIEHVLLDLTSLPSIKFSADHVLSKSHRLDILILNAGIMATPPGRTPSGQDIQLGTNHVGHFLLTKLLLPLLSKTASQPDSDVRVVSLSSEAFNLAPPLSTILSTEKLVAKGPWARYGASKAANIMFAAELARRYPHITSVSLHPGVIKTDLYVPGAESNWVVRYGSRLLGSLIFQSVQDGALNSLWAGAGAKKEQLVNGAYYTPVGMERKNKWAQDMDAGSKLWEWTESELKAAGY